MSPDWRVHADGAARGRGADASRQHESQQSDRAKGAVTADQQKENRPIASSPRRSGKSVMDDKSLSTYAHNVKIITQDGKVTLKGPVRSEEEKRRSSQGDRIRRRRPRDERDYDRACRRAAETQGLTERGDARCAPQR